MRRTVKTFFAVLCVASAGACASPVLHGGDAGNDSGHDGSTAFDVVPETSIDAPFDQRADIVGDRPSDLAIDRADVADVRIDAPVSDSTSCPAGQMPCASGCRNTLNDLANCGLCGNACPSGPNSNAFCAGGACGLTCTTSFANCDNNASTGCEVGLGTDSNCSGCGNVCTGGKHCSGGSCICPTTAPTDCSGRCVNTSTDKNNCGACGTVCPDFPATNRVGVCLSGTCSTRCVGSACNASCCPSGDLCCPCFDPDIGSYHICAPDCATAC